LPATQRFVTSVRDGRAATWIAGAVLVLVGFAVYANSLSNPFVFDDGYAITGNAHLHDLSDLRLSLTGPPGSGTSGRPLTALSLAVNYAIGGLDVTGYHIFNIAVHVLAAWVLFGFGRRTLRGPRLVGRFAAHADGIAFAIALLWLVHPLHTAAIDHVSYRNEVMMGFFYLLTLYAFVRATLSPARPWGALAIVACFLGTASKEVMGTAPLMVLLYDRTFVSSSFATALRRHKGIYAGLCASWLLLAYLIVTGDRGESVSIHIQDCTPVDYVRTQFAVVTHYLRAAFWPSRLAIDYNQPIATRLQPVLPQFFFLTALGFATLVAIVRRSPWVFWVRGSS
jgi:hypothetical protein